MKKKFKSILCAAVASIEVMSACSAGTLLSYAADFDVEKELAEIPAVGADYDTQANAEITTTFEIQVTETSTTTAALPTTTETTTTDVTTTAEIQTSTETTTTDIQASTETTTAPSGVDFDIKTDVENAPVVGADFEVKPETDDEKSSSSVLTEGWNKDSQGRIYYYKKTNNKLEPVKGVYTINGQPYLFADNGVLKTGWRTIDNKRYYFDHKTGKAVYGWVDYEGNDYYVSKNDGKQTGFFMDSDGICYLFTEQGALYEPEQFVTYNNNIYYIKSDKTLATGETMIGDTPYVFAPNGILKTGWRTYGGKRYYYDEKGELKTGLITYCGNKYYITKKDGKCSGVIEIDGLKYVFAKATGAMALGWQTVDGKKHFYFTDGKAAVGIQKIDGDTYYFNEKGELATGWQTVNGELMYFAPDGSKMTGWQTIDGSKYYFVSSGKPAIGLVTIEGNLYNFSEEGKMQTGWFNMNTGARYYFKQDGTAIKGFQKFTDGMHYFLSDYTMALGWQTIDNKLYFFDEKTGVMAVDTKIGEYTIDANGVATKVNVTQQKANNIIASVGSNLINLYNYVKSNNSYKFIEQTRSLEEIETVGWSYFADYAMDNRFVVCYYFAALTDLLFQQAGYETRIVYGTGRGEGEHYWNQVKINGVWTNYDACNGYADVTDDFLKSKNYTWYKYVNAKFD